MFLFIFSPTWGNDPIWRAYFSDGLVKNHQVGIEYIFGVAPSQDGKSDYDDGYWNPGVLGATNQDSTSFIFSEIGWNGRYIHLK